MMWRVAATLAMAGVALAQTPPAWQSLLRAVELHQAGKPGEAIPHYEEFLRSEPRRPDIRSNLGAALSAVGRFDDAIEQYRMALDSLPDHAGIRKNLALAYYKSARLAEAIEELERPGGAVPADVDTTLLLADCHFRLGEDERVVQLLRPLAPGHTDNSALAYLLGTALIRTGDVSGGQLLVDRILSRGESAEAHLMMGTAHVTGGDFEKAALEFRKAIALNAALPLAHSHLGKTELELGERAAAEKNFRKELEINPNDFDANFMLGVMLRESQKHEEAEGFLAKARRLRPNALEVGYQIAANHLALRRDREAAAELEALLAKAPDFAEAHASLATAYFRLGRRQDAAKHRDIARQLNSTPKAAAAKP